MAEKTYLHAISDALRSEMRRDKRVFILGEDVAHLKVRSIHPTDVPLPFAEHGFFSSTVLASTVAAAGGPVNFVDVMLAAEEAAA